MELQVLHQVVILQVEEVVLRQELTEEQQEQVVLGEEEQVLDIRPQEVLVL
jgi:hypothetical protein